MHHARGLAVSGMMSLQRACLLGRRNYGGDGECRLLNIVDVLLGRHREKSTSRFDANGRLTNILAEELQG